MNRKKNIDMYFKMSRLAIYSLCVCINTCSIYNIQVTTQLEERENTYNSGLHLISHKYLMVF